MGAVAFVGFLVVTGLWASASVAQDSTPEIAVPAPSWARSIEIVNDGAPVMLGPSPESRRRGTVGAGTRLGFLRRVLGKGCSTGAWYETTDRLFVCEEHVKPSVEPPGRKLWPTAGDRATLPRRYAFVRVDGTRAYAHPSDYFGYEYVEAFGRGFGIVVTGEQVYRGVEFVRTRRHLWVERDSVRFVNGSSFRGATLRPQVPLDIAWISPRSAKLFDRPSGRVIGALERQLEVRVAKAEGAWVKLRQGGWVRRSSLARPQKTPRPEGVGPDDRWIDVHLAEQVLVAYQGDAPRFATLISSGKNTKASATPTGLFTLWAKLDFTDMDDIERTDIPQNYSIQDVPWVQFFEGAYGFHAAFWHDDFGRRRSHGCINLSPADARYLFQFTEPVLPAGWNAILALPQDGPTVVQVR